MANIVTKPLKVDKTVSDNNRVTVFSKFEKQSLLDFKDDSNEALLSKFQNEMREPAPSSLINTFEYEKFKIELKEEEQEQP